MSIASEQARHALAVLSAAIPSGTGARAGWGDPTAAAVTKFEGNAFAERFVRSVKDECVGRMVFFNRSSLERALTEYVTHYHQERNHQGFGNQLLQDAGAVTNRRDGRVQRSSDERPGEVIDRWSVCCGRGDA